MWIRLGERRWERVLREHLKTWMLDLRFARDPLDRVVSKVKHGSDSYQCKKVGYHAPPSWRKIFLQVPRLYQGLCSTSKQKLSTHVDRRQRWRRLHRLQYVVQTQIVYHCRMRPAVCYTYNFLYLNWEWGKISLLSAPLVLHWKELSKNWRLR